jgi:hypothetical protein
VNQVVRFLKAISETDFNRPQVHQEIWDRQLIEILPRKPRTVLPRRRTIPFRRAAAADRVEEVFQVRLARRYIEEHGNLVFRQLCGVENVILRGLFGHGHGLAPSVGIVGNPMYLLGSY